MELTSCSLMPFNCQSRALTGQMHSKERKKADESGAEAGTNIWEQINLSIENKDTWNFASSQLKLALLTALKCIFCLLSKPFFLFDCSCFQSRRLIRFQATILLGLLCPPSKGMICKPYENCRLSWQEITAHIELS